LVVDLALAVFGREVRGVAIVEVMRFPLQDRVSPDEVVRVAAVEPVGVERPCKVGLGNVPVRSPPADDPFFK